MKAFSKTGKVSKYTFNLCRVVFAKYPNNKGGLSYHYQGVNFVSVMAVTQLISDDIQDKAIK